MEIKHKQIIGQILLAVGLTLTVGGIASFYFSNVELRFFEREILTENGRILWIVIYAFIALSGLLILRTAKGR